MAGISIPKPNTRLSAKPSAATQVRGPSAGGGAKNFNRDRTTVMRPPRLMPLPTPTRMYAKQPPADSPMGAGFGQTGLTGET